MNTDEHKEQVRLAYHSAIKFLSTREHSKKEIFNKLYSRKYSDDIINDVIEQLVQQNYLDETRYTEMYCRSRINRRYGKKKIAFELAQKGIKGSMLQHALKDVDERVWLDAIKKQISKKVTKVPVLFPDKIKLFRSLATRGFESQEIQTAFEEFIETFT